MKLLDSSTSPKPDHVYVLPGYLRVTIKQGVLMVRRRRNEERLNKAIDEFLLSLADDQKHHGLAVILAGMGSDGSVGVKAVHEHGGEVFVQHPNTTSHKEMPKNAIKCDNPIEILSPADLGEALNEWVQSRSVQKSASGN